MSQNAFRRLTTALVVVVSLLFSQLALAAYVCPGAPAGDEAAAVMEMAPGHPCEGVASDEEQPSLCYQHCADAPQSFDTLKLPTVSLPAVVHVLAVPLVLDVAEQHVRAWAAQGPQPPPEPLFLSTLRLRV